MNEQIRDFYVSITKLLLHRPSTLLKFDESIILSPTARNIFKKSLEKVFIDMYESLSTNQEYSKDVYPLALSIKDGCIQYIQVVLGASQPTNDSYQSVKESFESIEKSSIELFNSLPYFCDKFLAIRYCLIAILMQFSFCIPTKTDLDTSLVEKCKDVFYNYLLKLPEVAQTIKDEFENNSIFTSFLISNVDAKLLRRGILYEVTHVRYILRTYTNYKYDISNPLPSKANELIEVVRAEPKSVRLHRGRIYTMALLDDKLYTGSEDTIITVWDLYTHLEIKKLEGHTGGIRCLLTTVNNDGRWLLSGSSDNTIKLWDTATFLEVASFIGHDDFIFSVCFNYDKTKLFSGSRDRQIMVWDVKNRSCEGIFKGHTDSIFSIVASKDRLYSASGDTSIKVWDLESFSEIQSLDSHGGDVMGLVIYNDWLISGSIDKSIIIWDINTFSQIEILNGHKYSVLSLLIIEDKLYSTSFDNTIRVWDLKSKTMDSVLRGHRKAVTSLVAFDNFLISGSWDKTINVRVL
eukprot:gene10971-14735_t